MKAPAQGPAHAAQRRTAALPPDALPSKVVSGLFEQWQLPVSHAHHGKRSMDLLEGLRRPPSSAQQLSRLVRCRSWQVAAATQPHAPASALLGLLKGLRRSP